MPLKCGRVLVSSQSAKLADLIAAVEPNLFTQERINCTHVLIQTFGVVDFRTDGAAAAVGQAFKWAEGNTSLMSAALLPTITVVAASDTEVAFALLSH